MGEGKGEGVGEGKERRERRERERKEEIEIGVEDLCYLETTQGVMAVPAERGLAWFSFPWNHFLLGLRF